VTPRRPKPTGYDRRTNLPRDVNKFGCGFPDPLAFPGAGRRRDPALSVAVRTRRAEADRTAELLLRGGLREDEVHAAIDGDTILDLASCGALRDYLGRQRRRTARLAPDADPAGGPWDDFRVPFVFSANGRPYLRQMETESGI
jgi:hypothetical protein